MHEAFEPLSTHASAFTVLDWRKLQEERLWDEQCLYQRVATEATTLHSLLYAGSISFRLVSALPFPFRHTVHSSLKKFFHDHHLPYIPLPSQSAFLHHSLQPM